MYCPVDPESSESMDGSYFTSNVSTHDNDESPIHYDASPTRNYDAFHHFQLFDPKMHDPKTDDTDNESFFESEAQVPVSLLESKMQDPVSPSESKTQGPVSFSESETQSSALLSGSKSYIPVSFTASQGRMPAPNSSGDYTCVNETVTQGTDNCPCGDNGEVVDRRLLDCHGDRNESGRIKFMKRTAKK